jgi:hypothetical protein
MATTIKTRGRPSRNLTVPIHVYLTKEDHHRLRVAAAQAGMVMPDFVRKWLLRGVVEVEEGLKEAKP